MLSCRHSMLLHSKRFTTVGTALSLLAGLSPSPAQGTQAFTMHCRFPRKGQAHCLQQDICKFMLSVSQVKTKHSRAFSVTQLLSQMGNTGYCLKLLLPSARQNNSTEVDHGNILLGKWRFRNLRHFQGHRN